MQYSPATHPDTYRFAFENDGGRIPVDAWDQIEHSELAPKWWLLQELVDNGLAAAYDDHIRVPHEEVVRLSRSDQQLLELPDPYPFEIRLDADGVLNRSGFGFQVGFFVHADGERLPLKRTGCVLHAADQEYLLSSEQYAFCTSVSAFNRGTHEEAENPLRAYADIRALAEQAGVSLDSYLDNERVVAPETIEVDVELDGKAFQIGPRISGIDNDALQKRFKRFPEPLPTYSTSQSGQPARVAFSGKQQEALNSLKRYERADGEQRKALVEHPETVLDPDVFDLDQFSERVVELGYYKPTFFPFISPYKSQWIPGFLVETSPEERKEVRFESEEDLHEFESSLQEAKAQGEKNVTWDDIDIPIVEGERIAETASQQFRDPDTPVTEQQEPGEGARDQVLIIRSNVEDDEYSEIGDAPTTEGFAHEYRPPPDLRAAFSPRDHQRAGIAWMQSLFDNRYSGGLLADDMGLGKTFQVLSFIKWHNERSNAQDKPYLIVAPVALLENWEKEYDKFFEPSPPLVETLHGQALRDLVHGDVESHWRKGADQLSKGGLYLTTYGSLRRYQLLYGAVDWGLVALDEAQKIKNPSTQVTSAAKALKAEFKLPMTGTPVENSLVDLWCLMDFAVPGLLGSAKSFAKSYQSPLRDEDTDLKQLGEQLRDDLGVYIKRRLKSQVADELPKKKVHRSSAAMPSEQFQRYLLEIEQAEQARQSGEGRGSEVLRALHAMRIISDHPYLADRRVDDVPCERLIPLSAKLKQTVDILNRIRDKEEKAILYADRKATQRMLAKVLREVFGIPTRIINGDTPAGNTGSASRKTRQELINEFEDRDGFGALVMSPIAAGVGLNITAANHVIHYARHWNPAKEDQATDRVYRIGQEKDVHVYYPMCTIPDDNFQSFDLILDDLLRRKRALADASLFPSERVEVEPADLYATTLNSQGDATVSVEEQAIDSDTAGSLDPYLFEAVIGVLWKKRGYDVSLTPKQSDRGADLIAQKDGGTILIQVKQQSKNLNANPIREVYSAAPYYTEYLDAGVDQLVVISNAQGYTSGARELAESNEVTLVARSQLTGLLDQYPVTLREVRRLDASRIEL